MRPRSEHQATPEPLSATFGATLEATQRPLNGYAEATLRTRYDTWLAETAALLKELAA